MCFVYMHAVSAVEFVSKLFKNATLQVCGTMGIRVEHRILLAQSRCDMWFQKSGFFGHMWAMWVKFSCGQVSLANAPALAVWYSFFDLKVSFWFSGMIEFDGVCDEVTPSRPLNDKVSLSWSVSWIRAWIHVLEGIFSHCVCLQDARDGKASELSRGLLCA